jgi:rod shape-determining protein MreB
MALFSKDLGIDLGTNNTRAAEGDQVILDEPTVAAIIISEQKMVSWGKEAQDMLGRVPDSIEVNRPLRNGVIADYEVAEYILRDILRKLSGPLQFFRPQVMITVPNGITSVERRAVHEAALQAGSRDVALA